MQDIELRSSAFEPGTEIPVRYTCDGPDLSPPLSWKSPPPGTKSLVLLVDDPDAARGVWVHWIVWGIAPETTSLPEGVTTDRILSKNARQGKNSFGGIGWGGPCPPDGPAHNYRFRLYALDTEIDLDANATRANLLAAMDRHILAQGNFTAPYTRMKR